MVCFDAVIRPGWDLYDFAIELHKKVNKKDGVNKRYKRQDADPNWAPYLIDDVPKSIEKYYMVRNFTNIEYIPKYMAGQKTPRKIIVRNMPTMALLTNEGFFPGSLYWTRAENVALPMEIVTELGNAETEKAGVEGAELH